MRPCCKVAMAACLNLGRCRSAEAATGRRETRATYLEVAWSMLLTLLSFCQKLISNEKSSSCAQTPAQKRSKTCKQTNKQMSKRTTVIVVWSTQEHEIDPPFTFDHADRSLLQPTVLIATSVELPTLFRTRINTSYFRIAVHVVRRYTINGGIQSFP